MRLAYDNAKDMKKERKKKRKKGRLNFKVKKVCNTGHRLISTITFVVIITI